MSVETQEDKSNNEQPESHTTGVQLMEHPHVPTLLSEIPLRHATWQKHFVKSRYKEVANLYMAEFDLLDFETSDYRFLKSRAVGEDRYGNIRPAEAARVRLCPQQPVTTSGSTATNTSTDGESRLNQTPDPTYINASHISMELPGTLPIGSYIVMQAPASAARFWRMVLEQRVGFVVMLTRLVEHSKTSSARGRSETKANEKAQVYWPVGGEKIVFDKLDQDGVKQQGSVEVDADRKEQHVFLKALDQTKSTSSTDPDSKIGDIVLRYFVVRYGKVTQKVVQMHFRQWLDFTAPNLHAFAEFFQLYRKLRQEITLNLSDKEANHFDKLITLDQIRQELKQEYAQSQVTDDNNDSNNNPSEQKQVPQMQGFDSRNFWEPFVDATYLQQPELPLPQGVSGRVVVHCSAGVGRTGTFMMVEIILDYFAGLLHCIRNQHSIVGEKEKAFQSKLTEQSRAVSVYKVLRAMRLARHRLVFKKEQYEFVYAFLDHCVRHRLYSII